VDFVVQLREDGCDVTTYSRIALDPGDAGGDHFTVIDVAVPLA
jgi:hypothetical protein